MEKPKRASKKQRELLQFIEGFIKGYGYGPSYREIMRALGYKSVSTVAVHVDGLITAGFLRKKTRSARSLELIPTTVTKPTDDHQKWLKEVIRTKMDTDISSDDRIILERALELLTKD